MKKLTILTAVAFCLLWGGLALATCDPGGCSVGSVAINGATSLADNNTGNSCFGQTSICDFTKQTNWVTGSAFGNASGNALYGQQADTGLAKNSSSPFGASGASVEKTGVQSLSLNVSGPFGIAAGNQAQTNSGCVTTGAGPGSTFSAANGQVGQNMSLGALGGANVSGEQLTARQSVFGAVSQIGPSYTQNMGQMSLNANQQGAAFGPCPSLQAGTNKAAGSVNAATGFVVTPGGITANSSLGANLSTQACGNLPTNYATGTIVANTGTYVKTPTTEAMQYQNINMQASAGH